MARPAATSDERAAQPRNSFALWTGMIGPPLLWLAHFQAKYALLAWHIGWVRGLLAAIAVLSVALTVALGLMSLRHWRLAPASPLDVEAGITSRIRFMAVIGMMSAALFGLLIVAQALAELFISPTQS